jgi:hypothetical protein
MTRIDRRLCVTTRLVLLAIAGECLVADLQAALQREGDNVVLTDKPRCRFAWPEWDYTNITNPLLLTKNTLDRSMIGIMRIRVGDTLPRGKTKVSATMSTQQISALLRENVLGRGQRVDSLTADNTTISGAPAVRLRFTEPGSPARKHAVEYGFIKGGYFFYLLFSAVDDPDYAHVLKDFQRIVSTFKVID